MTKKLLIMSANKYLVIHGDANKIDLFVKQYLFDTKTFQNVVSNSAVPYHYGEEKVLVIKTLKRLNGEITLEKGSYYVCDKQFLHYKSISLRYQSRFDLNLEEKKALEKLYKHFPKKILDLN